MSRIKMFGRPGNGAPTGVTIIILFVIFFANKSCKQPLYTFQWLESICYLDGCITDTFPPWWDFSVEGHHQKNCWGDVRKKKFTEHQLDLGMKRSQSMFALDTGPRHHWCWSSSWLVLMFILILILMLMLMFMLMTLLTIFIFIMIISSHPDQTMAD